MRPNVAIEASSIAALPRLIAEPRPLSFPSRRHLTEGRPGAPLIEIPNPLTTMDRHFGVLFRAERHIAPATRRFIAIAETQGAGLND